MQKWLYIIGMLSILSACQKEAALYTVDIAAELSPYIDRFVAEGAARGVAVDFAKEGLSARLTIIEEPGVPGQCQQQSEASNVLLIDQAYWANYNETERELLIFHELGHCYLDKNHNDLADEAGNCLSLMRSSNLACAIDHYTTDRSALLDELFD